MSWSLRHLQLSQMFYDTIHKLKGQHIILSDTIIKIALLFKLHHTYINLSQNSGKCPNFHTRGCVSIIIRGCEIKNRNCCDVCAPLSTYFDRCRIQNITLRTFWCSESIKSHCIWSLCHWVHPIWSGFFQIRQTRFHFLEEF